MKLLTIFRLILSLFIILIPTTNFGQVIQVDTFHSSKNLKIYDIIKYKGSCTVQIAESDTSIMYNNWLYYDFKLDSLKKTETYLTRDTISFNPDFFFIELYYCLEHSWAGNYHNLFFLYNEEFKGSNKGVVLLNKVNEKSRFCGYFGKSTLVQLIRILNDNMVLNHKKDFSYFDEDYLVTLSSFSRKMKVLVVDKGRKQENEYSVYDYQFGLGKKAYEEIYKLGTNYTYDNSSELFESFISINKKHLEESYLLSEMINRYLNENEYYFKYK
ncbi:hypothetical protein [Saccharicrinis aurantiacus]|uniref:hypothetical protein n=1 Tax=Saccharicrinis aurantiacus TaxID=1849719 RepID=UPI00083848D4|nr:hypothetical protein [Saccharicrinis aurantiacus]